LSKPPTWANDLFREETDDPLVADRRNFFKVELWTRDGQHVEQLLFAGNKARALFASYGKRRPRARLTSDRGAGCWRSGPRVGPEAWCETPNDCGVGQHGASDRRIHQGVTCFLKRELYF
jgi:hypothetical protein